MRNSADVGRHQAQFGDGKDGFLFGVTRMRRATEVFLASEQGCGWAGETGWGLERD